jgi:signal transduction histidine kinase
MRLIAGVLSAAVGRALAFQANLRLLAERTAALAALRRSERQLVQAQKLKAIGQLAAGMAHEINTPTQYVSDNLRFLDQALQDILTLVGEYERLSAAARAQGVLTELLPQVERSAERTDMPYLTAELPVAIRQSLEGLERIAAIVHGVKALSRRESEEKKPADLNAEIENTVTVSRNEWKYVADLDTELDPSLPPVPCVAGEINQVVLTLVINAAHAIADRVREHPGTKGRITVATHQVGDWVELRVRDTGTGIPEAVRPRIFEPFFTTKDVGKGMGQGLAIAHTIVVETHGGTIDFETVTGDGTTFTVRLPLATSCPDGAGAGS